MLSRLGCCFGSGAIKREPRRSVVEPGTSSPSSGQAHANVRCQKLASDSIKLLAALQQVSENSDASDSILRTQLQLKVAATYFNSDVSLYIFEASGCGKLVLNGCGSRLHSGGVPGGTWILDSPAPGTETNADLPPAQVTGLDNMLRVLRSCAAQQPTPLYARSRSGRLGAALVPLVCGSEVFGALLITYPGSDSLVTASSFPAESAASSPPHKTAAAAAAAVAAAEVSPTPDYLETCEPSLGQLGMALSMALTPERSSLRRLASSLARLADAASLRETVGEMCDTLSYHVRQRFLLEPAIRPAVVPDAEAVTAFMLDVEGRAGTASTTELSHRSRGTLPGGTGSGAAGFSARQPSAVRQSPQPSEQWDASCTPAAAAAAPGSTAITDSREPGAGSGAPVVALCRLGPSRRLIKADPLISHGDKAAATTGAAAAGGNVGDGACTTNLSASHGGGFDGLYGSPQPVPLSPGCVTAACEAAGGSVVARPFQLSYSLLLRLQLQQPRMCGLAVRDCIRLVKDVNQPSRDVCLLMGTSAGGGVAGSDAHISSSLLDTDEREAAMGAGGWPMRGALGAVGKVGSGGGGVNVHTNNSGNSHAGAGSVGAGGGGGAGGACVQSLALVGCHAGDGTTLGFYVCFPQRLPGPLVEAVRDSCQRLLDRVLLRAVAPKVSGELAAELGALRRGTPGTFAVVQTRHGLDQAEQCGQARFLLPSASTAVEPHLLLDILSSTAGGHAVVQSPPPPPPPQPPPPLQQQQLHQAMRLPRPSSLQLAGEPHARDFGFVLRSKSLCRTATICSQLQASTQLQPQMLQPSVPGPSRLCPNAQELAGALRTGGLGISAVRSGVQPGREREHAGSVRGGGGAAAAAATSRVLTCNGMYSTSTTVPGFSPRFARGPHCESAPQLCDVALALSQPSEGGTPPLPPPQPLLSSQSQKPGPVDGGRASLTMMTTIRTTSVLTICGLEEPAERSRRQLRALVSSVKDSIVSAAALGVSSTASSRGGGRDSGYGGGGGGAAAAAALSAAMMPSCTTTAAAAALGPPWMYSTGAAGDFHGGPSPAPSSAITPAAAAAAGLDSDAADVADLRLLTKLGQGGGGAVYLGQMAGGLEVAVKLLDLAESFDMSDFVDAFVPPDAELPGVASTAAVADPRLQSSRRGQQAAAPAPAAAGLAGDGGLGEMLVAEAARQQVRARRSLLQSATELAMLTSVSHPNIVQVYGFYSNLVLQTDVLPGGGVGYRLQPRPQALEEGSMEECGILDFAPACSAVCMTYCDLGSLSRVLAAGAFLEEPGAATHGSRGLPGKPEAPRAAAAKTVASKVDSPGFGAAILKHIRSVYLTLLEVALALRYLHGRNIVHRDLKPGNILLKSRSPTPGDPRGFTTKLADFGLALVLDCEATPAQEHQHQQLQPSQRQRAAPFGAAACPGSLREGEGEVVGRGAAPESRPGAGGGRYVVQDKACGTVDHMAPEALRSKGSRLTAAADIYSFGVVMLEVVTAGRRPFGAAPPDRIARLVSMGTRPVFPAWVPTPYRSLAEACWAQDPQRRPSAAQLVGAIRQLLQRRGEEFATGQPAGAIPAPAASAAAAAVAPLSRQ